MTARRADLVCLVLVLIPVAMSAWLWPALPDPMPGHWNAQGEVDAYLPKFWGVATMPLSAVGVWLLVKIIPAVSPKGYRTEPFREVLHLFQVVIVAFLALVGVLVLLEARGVDTKLNTIIFAGAGLLLLVIGNYLGKVRKNFFVGFRSPWTLASDEVWARTHRLGGWLFVVAGLVMIAGGLAGFPAPWLIGAVVLLTVYPLLHSYLLYRKLEGFEPEHDSED